MPQPVLASRVKAGVAAGGSERPRLAAGTDAAAKKALETLDREFPGNSSSCVLAITPPELIKRASVVQPRWAGVRLRYHCSPFDQNGLHLKDVPVWRDAPSDAIDAANVPPPSPGPVWRDSEELVRELNTRDTRGDYHFQLPKTQKVRRPARASSSASRRSPSPLGNLLRRTRSKPESSAAVAGGGKRDTNTTRAPSRRKRTAKGEAVWKDSPAATRMSVDPTLLLDLMSSAEAAPRKTIGNRGFSGSVAAAGGVGAACPLPPPPNEKSPKTNRDWRRITHPLRARRKDDQGLHLQQRRAPTSEKVLGSMMYFAGSLPSSAALTRSRDSNSIGFLSAASASSAASFWRTISSIPDGTAARSRSPTPFSGGTRLSSQAPTAPPRAPAFEPRGGPDHHRTRTNRRSRQHRVSAPGDEAQFRRSRSGRLERQHQATPVSR